MKTKEELQKVLYILNQIDNLLGAGIFSGAHCSALVEVKNYLHASKMDLQKQILNFPEEKPLQAVKS